MNYRVEKRGLFSVVGVKHRVKTEKSFVMIPQIWDETIRNGIAGRLMSLVAQNSNKEFDRGVLGILSDGDWGKNEDFWYYTAVLYDEETVPDGMERVIFPESQWVVFPAQSLADIIKAWKRLYIDWLPTSGYSLAPLPAIELYNPPGCMPQNELWIPINERNETNGYSKKD